MRTFLKYFNGNPIYDTAGKVIKTTRLNESYHYIESDEPEVLAALEKFIKSNKGGVSEITAAELADMKKKAADLMSLSVPDGIGGLQAAQDTLQPLYRPPAGGVEAVGSSMMSPDEELRVLRERVATMEKAAVTPPLESNIPPPTPPSVGRRGVKPTTPPVTNIP